MIRLSDRNGERDLTNLCVVNTAAHIPDPAGRNDAYIRYIGNHIYRDFKIQLA